MCSLRPGVPGLSDNIRVLSVIDRYLEHARIFYFHNNGEPLYLLASADWMQRNFDRRVEVAFPILQPALQNRIKEILEIQLAENVKGWWMQSNGRYFRGTADSGAESRSQERFYEMLSNGSWRSIKNDVA